MRDFLPFLLGNNLNSRCFISKYERKNYYYRKILINFIGFIQAGRKFGSPYVILKGGRIYPALRL